MGREQATPEQTTQCEERILREVEEVPCVTRSDNLDVTNEQTSLQWWIQQRKYVLVFLDQKGWMRGLVRLRGLLGA